MYTVGQRVLPTIIGLKGMSYKTQKNFHWYPGAFYGLLGSVGGRGGSERESGGLGAKPLRP